MKGREGQRLPAFSQQSQTWLRACRSQNAAGLKLSHPIAPNQAHGARSKILALLLPGPFPPARFPSWPPAKACCLPHPDQLAGVSLAMAHVVAAATPIDLCSPQTRELDFPFWNCVWKPGSCRGTGFLRNSGMLGGFFFSYERCVGWVGGTDSANSCTRGSAAFKRDLRGKAGLAPCGVGWQGRRCQCGTDTARVGVGLKEREISTARGLS